MENKNLYQKLVEAVDSLPKEAVESAKKADTRKGYDTTGYQYQYLVNVLNEVCGYGKWGMSFVIAKEMKGAYTSGKEFYDITADVTIWILDGELKAEFVGVGGHQSSVYADAKKGAITNGFKKTLSFFGIGKKAYEGTLDEDFKPLEDLPASKPIAKVEAPKPIAKAPIKKTFTLKETITHAIENAEEVEKIDVLIGKITASTKIEDEDKNELMQMCSEKKDSILFALSEIK